MKWSVAVRRWVAGAGWRWANWASKKNLLSGCTFTLSFFFFCLRLWSVNVFILELAENPSFFCGGHFYHLSLWPSCCAVFLLSLWQKLCIFNGAKWNSCMRCDYDLVIWFMSSILFLILITSTYERKDDSIISPVWWLCREPSGWLINWLELGFSFCPRADLGPSGLHGLIQNLYAGCWEPTSHRS